MKVLCLAGTLTTKIVINECENVGLEYKSCSSTEEACNLITGPDSNEWIAIVMSFSIIWL